MSNQLPPRPPPRKPERKITVEDIPMLRDQSFMSGTYMSSFDTMLSKQDSPPREKEGLLNVLEDFIIQELRGYVSSDSDSDSDDDGESLETASSGSSGGSTFDDDDNDDNAMAESYKPKNRMRSMEYSVRRKKKEKKMGHTPVQKRLAQYLDGTPTSKSYSFFREGSSPDDAALSMLEEVQRLSSKVQSTRAVFSSPDKQLEQEGDMDKVLPAPLVGQDASGMQSRSLSYFKAEHVKSRSKLSELGDLQNIPSDLGRQSGTFGTSGAIAEKTQTPCDLVESEISKAGCSPAGLHLGSFKHRSLNDAIRDSMGVLQTSPTSTYDEEVIEFKSSESPVEGGVKESLWNNQSMWERWNPMEEKMVTRNIVKNTFCALDTTEHEVFDQHLDYDMRDDRDCDRVSLAARTEEMECVGKYKFHNNFRQCSEAREGPEWKPSPQLTRAVLRSPTSASLSPSPGQPSSPAEPVEESQPEMKITGLVSPVAALRSRTTDLPLNTHGRSSSSKSHFYDSVQKVKCQSAQDSDGIEVLRETSGVLNDATGVTEQIFSTKHPSKAKHFMPVGKGSNGGSPSGRDEVPSAPIPVPPNLPVPAAEKNSSEAEVQVTRLCRNAVTGSIVYENDSPESKMAKKFLPKRSSSGKSPSEKKPRTGLPPLSEEGKTERATPLKISGLGSSGDVEVQSGCLHEAGPTVSRALPLETPMSLYDSEGCKVGKKARRGLFRRPSPPGSKGRPSPPGSKGGPSPNPPELKDSTSTGDSPNRSRRFRLRFPRAKPGVKCKLSENAPSSQLHPTAEPANTKSTKSGSRQHAPASKAGSSKGAKSSKSAHPKDTDTLVAHSFDAVAITPMEAVRSYGFDSDNSIITGIESQQTMMQRQACMDLHPLVLNNEGRRDSSNPTQNHQLVLYPLLDFNPCHGELMLSPELENHRFDFDRLEKAARRDLPKENSSASSSDEMIPPPPISTRRPSPAPKKSYPEPPLPVHKNATKTVLQDACAVKESPTTKKQGFGNIFRRAFGKNPHPQHRKSILLQTHFPEQAVAGASEQSVECSLGLPSTPRTSPGGTSKGKSEVTTIANSCMQSPLKERQANSLPPNGSGAAMHGGKASKEVSSPSPLVKYKKGLTKSEKQVARRLVNDLKLLSQIEERRRLLELRTSSEADFADRVKSIESSLKAMIQLDGMVRDRVQTGAPKKTKKKSKKKSPNKRKPLPEQPSFMSSFSKDIFTTFFCSCGE